MYTLKRSYHIGGLSKVCIFKAYTELIDIHYSNWRLMTTQLSHKQQLVTVPNNASPILK